MKIRKRNTRCVAAVIVLSMAGLFAGCKGDTAGKEQIEPKTIEEEILSTTSLVIESDRKEEKQEKQQEQDGEIIDKNDTADRNNAEDKIDIADSQEALSGKIDIYDVVLEEYRDMVRNDFYMNFRDSDDYESKFGADIGLEIRTHKQDIYYAFYDIDGNGTAELIIAGGENGVSNPVFTPWNYDLYGYDGTKVVHIFPETEFGYRTNFSLYKDGIIEVFYSSSAAESGIDFYRIGGDGVVPELIESFMAVGHLEGDEAVFDYFRNGDEISKKEYEEGVQRYEVGIAAELDWVEIR